MFLSPEKLVEYCDVHHGMKVADIGAGIGQYAILLAKRVGSNGKVYAIDVQKDLLSKLSSDAKKEKLSNIDTIWGDVEVANGTKLHDESVDRVFLVNTFFQIENKESFVAEIKRILKKGGKVIFIDWLGSMSGVGPHRNHLVSPKAAYDYFEKERFTKERDIPAGEHHYGIIFVK